MRRYNKTLSFERENDDQYIDGFKMKSSVKHALCF